MNDAGVIKPVRGIVPKDLSKLFSGEMTLDESFVQCVENNSLKSSRKEIRQQKKDEKAFEEIRSELVLQAFGMTKEDYKKFFEVYQEIQNGEHDFDMTDAGKVKRKIAVANVQNNSNKRAAKSWLSNLAKGIVVTVGGISLGTVLSPVLAPIVGPLLASKFVELSTICASAGYAAYKVKKAEKGNVGDYQEKQIEADEELISLIEKIQTLENALVADKAMILEKKKTLKKDAFNVFIVDYLKEKMASLGLINSNENIIENQNKIIEDVKNDDLKKEELKDLEELNENQLGG